MENLSDQRVLRRNIRSRRCQQTSLVVHQSIMNSNQNAAPMQIALDGLLASGKSTVGTMLADKLGCDFLDTGKMYRAVTFLSIKNRISIKDIDAVHNIAANTNFTLSQDQNGTWRLFADGKDITDHLYSDDVNFNVSAVSAIPAVRRALVRQQRAIASTAPIVMAGQDIGTVVLPHAGVKIFLTASAETRARRRTKDADGNADQRPYNEVLQSIQRRQRIDSSRTDSPLRPANDAIIVATDDLTAEEVVEKILSHFYNKTNLIDSPQMMGGHAG